MKSKKATEKSSDRYAAPALDKGLDILELLAGRPEGLSLKQIADALGRSSTEIFRMLNQLRERAYIHRFEPGGIYRLSLKMFELAHRFHHIQIEGEFGQGKPELAVYRHALERLGVDAADAWMVGDNYEWEVVAPQALGMCGIWYDPFEAGVPSQAAATPSRIIKRLA